MNEQRQDRINKREKLRALGVDPYGSRFVDIVKNADIRRSAEGLTIEPGQTLDSSASRFRAAGRVMLYRDIGKLIFLTIRDWTGELQIGISKSTVGSTGVSPVAASDEATKRRSDGGEGPGNPSAAPADVQWQIAKTLDLGDVIGVEGHIGRTKTGELTLWATSLRLLSKCVQPPPEKWHGLTDTEARYRRRYVDLFANPESRDVFIRRAKIIQHIRETLHARSFIEVDTPVLQPIYGGAAARPFLTHHNTLDMKLFLRISPELYLKRCMVGGLERVYEFSRCFRNEGISPRHNPEFTMLELYQAYGDYHDMMDITEAIVAGAAEKVIGSCKITFGGREIDYSPPFARRRYADLYREHVGIAISDIPAARERARKLGFVEKDADDAIVVNTLFEHYCEDKLINPTFVLDYPAPICPLTKRDPNDPNTALRFELFVNGMELGNAYTELNDPDVQRATFSASLRGEGEETMAVMDEDFVEALEYAMPPAGGLGIGIDRLVMLLTGSSSIRDVLLFPLQRPEGAGVTPPRA